MIYFQYINNNLQDDKDDGKRLIDYLNQGKESEFISFSHRCVGDLVDYSDDCSTLLQICCKNNLIEAAKYLLQNGADPNKTGSKDHKKPVSSRNDK